MQGFPEVFLMNPHPLAPLIYQLKSAQRRWRWRRVMGGVCGWLLLIGLLGILNTLGWLERELVVGLVAIGFLAATIRSLGRSPSVFELAQLAERRWPLHQRLSTAIEAAEQPRSSMLLDLLLQDAALHGKQVSARELIRLNLPRWGWLVPLAAGVWATLALVWPANLSPTAAAPAISEAKVLQRVAQAVQREATVRSDLHLQALAQKAQRLQRQASQSPPSRQLESQMSQLASQINQALGTLPNALDRSQQSTSNPATGSSGSANQPLARQQALASQQLEDLAKRLELAQAQRISNPNPTDSPGTSESETCYEGDCLDAKTIERIAREEAAQRRIKAQGPQGDMAGGTSDRAGSQGSSGPASPSLKVANPQQNLNLGTKLATSGRRIELSAAPQTPSAVAVVLSRPVGGAFVATSESPAPSQAVLTPQAQAAVERFFSRQEP